MIEEQKKLVETIEQISAMIENGKMPLELCPVSDLEQAFSCALNYNSTDNDSEQMVSDFSILFDKMVEEKQKKESAMLLQFVAHVILYELEKRSFYDKKCAELVAKIEKIEEANNLYEEIIKHYHEKTINEEFLESHTYHSLVEVKKRGDMELFKKISSTVYETIIDRLRKKDTIKIVFFLKDSAEWSCEELYKKYSRSDKYEITIVVAPFFVGTQKTITDTYTNTIEYFKERNIPVVGIYDIYQSRYKSWKEIGLPDIVFHLNPHYTAFNGSSNICNFPLSILNVYIPYGMMIYGNVEHQFNQLSHMLYWKIFCETKCHKEMAKKYSDIGDYNVVDSGYVKMDTLLNTDIASNRKIWKISPKADEKKVKKIIYAPHWSVKDAFTGFGNFDKIYMELYEYVKNNQETTSWVFRPHPMLRAGVVQQGIFKSEKEYDEYLDKWNELPNAQVIEEGMYNDIFMTSDAMILDSVSFLAEYLYMHKPMLFLTRERNTFNDFGKELVQVLYKVDGADFTGIEKFIREIVLSENDYMMEEREKFYTKYLDYINNNGMTASEYIYHYIEKYLIDK